ncbi:MAG: ABC transporter ATP-binding protein [Muribaculaceae bacterium]|nr:ABC transporter ATP-binding protein [Muribaculaceae bacterium]
MQIELKGLSFSYGKKSPALTDVSATVNPGIHLLLGANGAGKTTLLHLIAGLLFASEGKCLIDGGPASYRLPSVLSKVFYLGVNTNWPAVNIKELVKVHGQFYPNFSADVLAANLAEFGIDPAMKFSAMSMGMRQKASVAYALALGVRILLLDEPATGLDIESKQALQRMMARCVDADATVIVSTHNFTDLLPLYDSLLVLDKGKLLLNAPVDSILERLAFVTTTGVAPAEALFTIRRFGSLHSIIPNTGNIESAIDYELIYLAIKQNNEIL